MLHALELLGIIALAVALLAALVGLVFCIYIFVRIARDKS